MKVSDEVKEEAMNFLKKNNAAVIATTQGGKVYASTVHYIVDEHWTFYFLAHRNTDKYLNISVSQQAALVVGVGPKHISVQTQGVVDMVVGDERAEILDKFKWLKGSHLIDHWPIEEMTKFENKESVAFKFEPSRLTFMNLDDEEYPRSQSKEYYQII